MINKKYYNDRSDAAIAFANWLHLNYTPKYDFEWNYNWITLKQGYIQRTTTDELYRVWETLDVNESLRREQAIKKRAESISVSGWLISEELRPGTPP